MYTPAFVEFLGTTLLLSAVAFTGSPLMIVAALSIAIALGGKVSGGHFNPAITAMMLVDGKIGQTKALLYMAAQLMAAVLVALVSKTVRV